MSATPRICFLLVLLLGASGQVVAQTSAAAPVGSGVDAGVDVDDARPEPANEIGPNDSPDAKLAKLARQRAMQEARRDRLLAGLAPDDPRRTEIVARFERLFAQLDAKQGRIEARTDGVAGQSRAPARVERGEHAQRPLAGDLPPRPERPVAVERAVRPDRPVPPERPVRPERTGVGHRGN